jgi:hypothetical protein
MKNTLLLVFFIAFCCAMLQVGTAQTLLFDSVVVIHSKGVFKDRGNKQWVETGLNGKSGFNFVETSRNTNAVFLLDSSRNVRIELNATEKTVYYSDSSRTRVALYSILLSLNGNNGKYYRVRSGGKCLQAVELEGGSLSPELMPCGVAGLASQQWNILERVVNGATTYRWRNLLSQMRGSDLCLSGSGVRTMVRFATCDTSDAQRWLNLRFTGSGLTNIRTLAVNDSVCLGIRYSTEGAPRFRRDEDGVLQKDLEFNTPMLAYCDERNDSSNTNNPLWAFQPL